ncbi:MAG TPA: serine protease [Phenylobacterium sp.]|jgi:V8-like Glu-specific endopeptidase|uniref:trypsin-like serine peptidase n=1 Tax=Phenylobacterium sp. TaxID=1871053 RepID=UPI002D57A6E9|nr:serine protease [Phenylobacterium sp.]HZZ69106.1 serine protease [Phenylobacterium sp.]
MVMDLSAQMMQATVQLEQPLGDGTRTVGTGFLISETSPDGKPHTILVTANHVFDKMPKTEARVGYRFPNSDGSWSYSPQTLRIRDAKGHPLWTHHPSRDVAAISINAPEAFAKAAIPEDYLAADDTFSKYKVEAGDQMMTLGFPRGLAANPAGFPILRSGRVASYPIAPAKIFPTFLLDFAVFPGNSGGPVFMSGPSRHAAGDNGQEGPDEEFIAGLLTQQVELNSERLGIGIVTNARFIRETIALIKDPNAPVTEVASEASISGAKAASAEEVAQPE